MTIMRDGKFSVTIENQKIISDVTCSFYQNIFVGTPISWALASLLAYRIQLDNAPNSILWIVLIPLIILSSTITIIAPIAAIRRYGKLAVEVFIQSDSIQIRFRNGDKVQISMNEIERSMLEFRIRKTTYNAVYFKSVKNKVSFIIVPELFESNEALIMWSKKV